MSSTAAPRSTEGAGSRTQGQHIAEGAMGRDYGRHSGVQHHANDYGIPVLRRALEAVPLPETGAPFRAADLGAASGSNSLDPMRVVVEGVRARAGADTAVTVVHTDILANDFDALLATIMDSPGSYAREPGVFAYAEARSFYEPLFPAGELHLAWSAIAVHWLSRVPEPIPDHIFSSRARGEVREALKAQSRADWEAFLGHRARELRPGGQLVVVGGAASDDGDSGADGLMDAAVEVLRELVRQGLIGEDEFARMTIPTWNRTAGEFLAPFREGSGEGREGGLGDVLRVEEHEQVVLPDVLLERYRESGNREAYADQVTAFFLAAFQPSLFSALGEERDVGVVAEALAEGMRTRVASDPEAVETHWHVLPMRVTRL
ncbi:hypothetical protein ABZ202_20590 [Streptomyces sp. NPDC006186]